MTAWERDRFGGYPQIHFEATGFFRLEKTPDRWWLVSPEGNAFLSWGSNHVMFNLLLCDYNIDHWAKSFGVADKSDKAAFLPGYRKKVLDDFKAFGWNTLGCHSPMNHYPPAFMPYVAQCRFVDICHYMTPAAEQYHDVFSTEFEKRCDEIARRDVLPRKDDPFVLGYSMTDCPVFTDLEAEARKNNVYGRERIALPTWPRVLRNLGPEAPGKREYVKTIRGLYADSIAAFNQTYGTAFDSFDALADAVDWRPDVDRANKREERDNLTFLFNVVDRCYAVEVAAIRRYDKNHILFGDKLNGNTDTPDEIVVLAAKHMDMLFYQYYAPYEDQKPTVDRWTKIAGKPIFHGDSCYCVPKERMDDPYGVHCADQKDRTERFKTSFYNLFSRPDYLGWNWCGWMDSWESNQPGKQHSGVQDPFGNYDEPTHAAMLEFSRNMYDVALGKVKG